MTKQLLIDIDDKEQEMLQGGILPVVEVLPIILASRIITAVALPVSVSINQQEKLDIFKARLEAKIKDKLGIA